MTARRAADPSSKEDALKYALRLLGYRGRSRHELAERLRIKGFEESASNAAIERLTALGYINDKAQAEALRRAAERKFLGKAGALRFLAQMGIGREQAHEALEGYDELERAREFIGRKSAKAPADALKMASALRRRGYSSSTIVKALRQ